MVIQKFANSWFCDMSLFQNLQSGIPRCVLAIKQWDEWFLGMDMFGQIVTKQQVLSGNQPEILGFSDWIFVVGTTRNIGISK